MQLILKRIGIWALVTCALLTIPLTLQLTIGTGIDGQGWNWKPNDFAIVGGLIFIVGAIYHILAFIFPKRSAALAVVMAIIFFWLYAELAVGVFTTWGS